MKGVETIGKCFVIQPFDNDTFEKRYVDIFEPAIKNANFEPYRVDKDLSVSVPIEHIEKEISQSAICFAEITTNNPNVWYELGFAFACSKDVIMVCSNERKDNFPFDIQHKSIIKYKTGSTSDFNILGETITGKINAIQQKNKSVFASFDDKIPLNKEGLKNHEIELLILIMENTIVADESTSVYFLKEQMGKLGYTDIATSLGFCFLKSYGMIKAIKETDSWDNDYTAVKLTEKGEKWIIANHAQFNFQLRKNNFDDLPF